MHDAARLSRRSCLLALPGLAAVAPAVACGASGQASEGESVSASYPSHDQPLVADMVGASHGRVARVRELLAASPEFAKAAYDWGFGDWETAIGAASHVGNREIVDLLLAHGARPDLFTFAMLGNVDAVRAIVTARPGIERLRGPHGLTLMHHARQGGDEAQATVEYLATLAGADLAYVNAPLPDDLRDAIVGSYSSPALGERRIAVALHGRTQQLRMRLGDGPERVLVHTGDLAFHPAGAESVIVRFAPDGSGGPSLSIGGVQPITARRVA